MSSLNSIIVCVFWLKKKEPFIHRSLEKTGPFTLETHIHVKALKMPNFPNNKMPY